VAQSRAFLIDIMKHNGGKSQVKCVDDRYVAGVSCNDIIERQAEQNIEADLYGSVDALAIIV